MSKPNSSKKSTFAEIRVVQHVVLALEALGDDAARARVLQWACAHFGMDPTSAAYADPELRYIRNHGRADEPSPNLNGS